MPHFCKPRWTAAERAEADAAPCARCVHHRRDSEFNFRWCDLHRDNPRFPFVPCDEFAER